MKKIVVFSIIAFLAVIGITGLVRGIGSAVVQPLAYNHKIHVAEAGLECVDCHLRVNEHERASIPNFELCSECHEEAVGESQAEKALIEFISEGRNIPWIQVHVVPPHAYFSHRRHVSLGGIECTKCHGEVSAMTSPFTKAYEEVSMEWCIDCHRERHIPIDCSTCHR
jgi:hypothetical protein